MTDLGINHVFPRELICEPKARRKHGVEWIVSWKVGIIFIKIVIEPVVGSIDVETLKSSISTVSIDTDYTGVDIGYEDGGSFNFYIKTSYGGIKLDDSINVQKKYSKDSKKEYQGYVGEPNSGNTMNIYSSYGGIRIRKN